MKNFPTKKITLGLLAGTFAFAQQSFAANMVTPMMPLPLSQLPGVQMPLMPGPMQLPGLGSHSNIPLTLTPVTPTLPSLPILEPEINEQHFPDVIRPVLPIPIEQPDWPTMPGTFVSPNAAAPVTVARRTPKTVPVAKAVKNIRQAFGMAPDQERPNAPAVSAAFDGVQFEAASQDAVDTRSEVDETVEDEEIALPWVQRPTGPLTLPEWDLAEELGIGLGQ